MNCKTCGASANRDDWNTWIAAFKTCPWCGMPAPCCVWHLAAPDDDDDDASDDEDAGDDISDIDQ